MANLRVSQEFRDRLKEEQAFGENVEDTLRYLLGWTDDEDDDTDEDAGDEE